MSTAVAMGAAALAGGTALAQTTPPTLTPGSTASGQIATTDPGYPDGMGNYDVWRIPVQAGQRITVSVSVETGGAFMVIGTNTSDEDCADCNIGFVEPGTPGTVSKTFPASGFAEVRISSDPSEGPVSYTVNATAAVPPPLRASSLRFGRPVQGTLSGTDAVNDLDGYEDAWDVQLRAGQEVQVDLSSEAFDPVVVVMRMGPGEPEVVAEDDDGGPGLNSRLRFAAPTRGTYRVLVRAFGGPGAEGAYTLRVGEPVVPPPPPAPTAISVGQVVTGAVNESSPILERFGEETRVQRYQFQARAGATYLVSAGSSQGEAAMEVAADGVDPETGMVGFGMSDGTGNTRVRYTATDDGPVVITLSAGGDGGEGAVAFTLEVSEAVVAPTPSAGRPLAIGQSVMGLLSDGGPRRAGTTQLYDIYALQLSEGDSVTVSLNSVEGGIQDPYLEIGHGTPASFEELAFNDDSGGGLNSRIRFVAPATGTYLVRASVLGEMDSGAYQLRVDRTAPPPPAPPPTPITLGQEVQGTLSEADPQIEDDTFDPARRFDAYTFVAEQGQTYVIELSAPEFDTYVYARQAGDGGWMSDDDSGGDLNSRLVYTAEASGPVTVRASSFGPNLEGGPAAYTLKVTRR